MEQLQINIKEQVKNEGHTIKESTAIYFKQVVEYTTSIIKIEKDADNNIRILYVLSL